MVKQCCRNHATISLPKNATQVYIKWRLSHKSCKTLNTVCLTSAQRALPPSTLVSQEQLHHPLDAIQKCNFILFQHQGFLNLLLVTLSLQGCLSARRVSGGMELAWLSQTERDATNPLTLYQLHFKYFRFLPYLHIPLFSFKLLERAQFSIWDSY